MIWRLAALVIAVLLAYAAGQVVCRAFTRNAHVPPASATPQRAPAMASRPAVPAPASVPAQPTRPCGGAPEFAEAAQRNANSLTGAEWSAFGRPETGWEIYAPLVAQELATACGPVEPGFAKALASWQGANGFMPTGVMDEPTLKALNVLWLRRRPFVVATSHGACPPPPPAFKLALATPAEGYLTKPITLRTTALSAYRRMVEAARQAVPALAADRQLLTIFSGFRDPAEEALRCARGSACGTIAKARCSAHRTGLALDLYLGAAPGFVPESSDDANRLFQSRTPVYRWLVAHAAEFGFVPYPFEPWHWEWTGEPL